MMIGMATTGEAMHRRLVSSLYSEAMLLADEARSYFDSTGRAQREALDPFGRVSFSCESLKVTTRLMHVIAWLLTQRAVEAGELSVQQALQPSRRLSPSPAVDEVEVGRLPGRARALVMASVALHRRAAAHDAALAGMGAVPLASPARSMLERLAAAL